MKIFLTLTLIISLSGGLVSCQTKPLKIVFESTQKDTATGLNEVKVYRLKKQATNSDFDYSKLNNLDENLGDTLNPKPAFEPINGHYNYYQFIATFKGHSFREVDTVFHDILIIKTDNNKKIIDAYQYTLEWAEMPSQYDLFKSSSKGLTFADNLEITSFKFSRTDYDDENDRLFKEGGHIKLK